MKLTAQELFEKMAKEIGRLQKLCKDHGIDPTPPVGPKQTMRVSASVQVFNTQKEAKEALKNSLKG